MSADPKEVPKLGEILLMNGWITWQQLESALKVQQKTRATLAAALVDSKVVTADQGRVLLLGEVFIRQNMISWEQLSVILEEQRKTGKILGEIALAKKFITSKQLYQALAIQYGKPFVEFDKVKIDPYALEFVPKHFAVEHQILPLIFKDDMLLVAVSNPLDVNAEAELVKKWPKYQIRISFAEPAELAAAIKKFYP